MNKLIHNIFSVLTAGLLLCSATAYAVADTAELDGTVVNTKATPVTVSYTGTIASLPIAAGETVAAGDTLAVLKTTKVYATQSGTIRLFGQAGDSASLLTEHYGAVAYIEPDVAFTISASTRNAYDSEETKIIHPGEKVYLKSSSTSSHVGTGIVTQVSGTSYTVDVQESNFEASEVVYVYRDEQYTSEQRIGRGSTTRSSYTTVEGSGIIVRYCVENGSHVNIGDVLFETLEGDFAGYDVDLTDVKAPFTGIVSELAISLGSSVTAGDTICTLYPADGMRVEAAVSEEYLQDFPVGTAVQVQFTYADGGGMSVGGTVEHVSSVRADTDAASSSEAAYTALIRLDDANNVRYGMTVTVTK